MNITFIGGGSLRLLPILRGVFADNPATLENSELRFYDLNVERANDVATMVASCPEFQSVNGCRVRVPETAEEALTGADVVYITMGIRRAPENGYSIYASNRFGFISTDQLSISGGFLAVQLGPVILDIARKMEQYCPKALMLIFANPVAVYSNMVNRYTKIRALGICGGFNNHRWDLTRLCGREAFDPEWNVVAAGVNHLSFILRGDYKGEDLYSSVMPKVLNENWKNIHAENPGGLQRSLGQLYTLYRKYGYLVFSTELDGLYHLFPEETVESQRNMVLPESEFDPEAAREKWFGNLNEQFRQFHEAAASAETLDWDSMKGLLFDKNERDITIPILKALAGIRKMRIVASDVNRGVLNSLPEDAAVEYTMDLFKDQITPVENQFIPLPFKGVISCLSEHQTLLADAIAKQDPKLFAAALDAYPIKQFTADHRAVVRKHFEIYSSSLNETMKQAESYFC